MPQPHRSSNDRHRQGLIRGRSPAIQTINRDQLRRAPYAVAPEIAVAKHNALIYQAIELAGPPGSVIARRIPTTREGHTLEVLVGWERLEAFTHPDAFPHATGVPVCVIDCNSADAAFYAIEFASQDQKAAGLVTSPLLYAAAAETALAHFSTPEEPWSIQRLANALCIARPTLSNRLRLLKGLRPKTRELLQQGLVKPEFAKILLAEPSPERQEHLATRVARGMMTKRTLYKLVHPEYQPPRLVTQPRGKARERSGDIGLMERTLSDTYGTAATIQLDYARQTGQVDLPFHSLSELKGLLVRLDTQIETDTLIKGRLSLEVNSLQDADVLLAELGANNDPALG